MHRRLLGAALAIAVGGTALAAAPGPTQAAPATCVGKPVTIVANRTVTTGTEGDDVVAMEPGAWSVFDALGGDDTICLALGRAGTGRDRTPPAGSVDAGPGDDTVVSLVPPGTTGAETTVVLGLGSDTYQGADAGELVYADTQTSRFEDPYESDDLYAPDPSFTGPQLDVVTGAPTVFSAAPADGPNQDRISLSGTQGLLVLDYGMGAEGRIEFPVGGAGRIELRGMRRLAPVAPSDVLVDNVDRAVEIGGVAVLGWSGDVRSFGLGTPNRDSREPAVSFIGTDADEALTITDGRVGDVAMGGGHDELFVNGVDAAFVPRSADGGAGDDSFTLVTPCRSLVVRLDVSATCGRTSGTLTGFEEAVADASWTHGSLVLVGTARGERLAGNAQRVTVRSGAGDDFVVVEQSYLTRVRAGDGQDRVRVNGDDVVVHGQDGGDRIRLLGYGGLSSVAGHHWRQVAVGGRGADDLRGTDDLRADRLAGGPGRDRADGRRGQRDWCGAEVVRRCERG